MRLILLTTIVSFLIINSTKAQWEIKHINDLSNNTGIVKFKNDSVGICLAGSAVLRTTDAGENWESLQADFAISDFQFIGDSVIYAIDGSSLVKSVDDGENWESVSVLSRKQLFSMCFFDIDSGLVAGYDGVYRTTNSGSSWDTVWSITQFGYAYGDVGKLIFPNSNIGYAIGAGRTQSNNPLFDNFLLKSYDSGLNWDTVITFNNMSLESVEFVNQDTGFIGTESGMILKTTDGGITWTENQLVGGNSVKSIQFISENIGYAVGGVIQYLTGGGGGTHFFISKSIDGGENWMTFDTLGLVLNSVCFLNDTTGFVAGDHELIMKTNGELAKLPEDYPWHLVELMGVETSTVQHNTIQVYPNPTDGIFFVEDLKTGDKIRSVSLTNLSGQVLYLNVLQAKSQIVKVDLTGFKHGLYFLKVEYSDHFETAKIIKR